MVVPTAQSLDQLGCSFHVSLHAPEEQETFFSQQWKKQRDQVQLGKVISMFCSPHIPSCIGQSKSQCVEKVYSSDKGAPLVAEMVKDPPANVGGSGLIPGSGRSPGEGNGYPL